MRGKRVKAIRRVYMGDQSIRYKEYDETLEGCIFRKDRGGMCRRLRKSKILMATVLYEVMERMKPGSGFVMKKAGGYRVNI